MSVLGKIVSMIRRARVSLSRSDTGTYPVTQISYLGKVADMEVIWPYGMNGQLPTDAIAICFNVEGMEENKAGIGNTPTLRLKVDAEGEVSFGNPLTESVTYFRANGDIETIGKNDMSITIDNNMNIDISGDASETVSGDKSLEVTGNKTEDITGNSTDTIAGTLSETATGAITITSSASVTVVAPAVNLGASGGSLKKLMNEDMISIFNNHTHDGVTTGGGSTGTPSSSITSETTSDTQAS